MTEPRVLLLAGLASSLAVWTASPAGVALVALTQAVFLMVSRPRLSARPLMAFSLFALYWAAMSALAAWIGGESVELAAKGAAVLVLRLAAMALVAGVLLARSTPLALARAVHWCLRPLGARRAAEAAASLLMMGRALSRLGGALAATRRAAAMRLGGLGAGKRLCLVLLHLVDTAEAEASDAEKGAVSRGLQTPSAWRLAALPTGSDCAFLAMSLLAAGLAWAL